jgi:hypothetical protein
MIPFVLNFVCYKLIIVRSIDVDRGGLLVVVYESRSHPHRCTAERLTL